MSEKFLSALEQQNLIPNTISPLNALGGIFSGLIFNPPPWQSGISEQMRNASRNMRADLDAMMAQQTMYVTQSRRARPPVAYWQFKNGKLAKIDDAHELIVPTYTAWDRSLGTHVVYAAR